MENDNQPLFPLHARKSVPSLYRKSKKKTIRMLSEVCRHESLHHQRVKGLRKYLALLPAIIQTDIMADMVPADRWRFPCVASQEILECRIHPECALGRGLSLIVVGDLK